MNIDSNKVITISKIDNSSFPVFINQGTGLEPIQYVLSDSDQVIFYLVPCNMQLCYYLIKKTFTIYDLNEDGNVELSFDRNDFKKISLGKYQYMIILKSYDLENKQIIKTIIPRTELFLVE